MKSEAFKKKALDEMFRRVGLDGFDDELIARHPDNWYRIYQWTAEEEQLYKDWLIDLYAKTFKYNKAQSRNQALWFLLSYGWSVKNT